MKPALRYFAFYFALLLLMLSAVAAEEERDMLITVTDGTHTVVFSLNETLAAKSLYAQLPLEIEVSNYGGNEKIFYPPEELDCTDAVEGSGLAGGLAYFSPWGNVVMCYGPYGQYPGLYMLGDAVSGTEQIAQLSGKLQITVYSEPDMAEAEPTETEPALLQTNQPDGRSS